MAVAPIDEDDTDENALRQLDEPVNKITDVQQAKRRIQALYEDKQRKTDYGRRLEKKALSLDKALAAQRDDVESLERTLLLENEKESADAKSRQIERDDKTRKQEDRIRNYLSDVLYSKPPPRPGTKKKNQVFELDTVLISFIRPNDNIRYNLPFRVDNSTTLRHLRDDACAYWEVSTEEFILKTMANSKCQNEIMVQDCFKRGEIAQLRLEIKQREQTKITEAEKKAIVPKKPKSGTKGYNSDKADMAVDNILKFTDKYNSSLKKLGGIYFLLKLRDLKPPDHVSKIRPRDCVIFLLLAILTFVCYSYQRTSGEHFWFLGGIENVVFQGCDQPPCIPASAGSVTVPPFLECKSLDDVWGFLQYTLPHLIWQNNTLVKQSLTTYNMLLGYVNIRQKSVVAPDPPWKNCDKFEDDVKALNNASCPADVVVSNDERKTKYAGLEAYWTAALAAHAKSDQIRGPAKPYQFVNEASNQKNHDIGTMHLELQTYDAGGFSAEYKMSDIAQSLLAENVQFYRNDIAAMKQHDWIDDLLTRAVFIDFCVYNYHYDVWAAVSLSFEFPPSGQVIPTANIRPFVPNLFETSADYNVIYVMAIRALIAGYILFGIAAFEIKHKTKNQKPGYRYYISLNGVCDVGVGVCVIVSVVIRFAIFNTKKTTMLITELQDASKSSGYRDWNDTARDYELLYIMEGLIFVLTCFRLISLFRLNHAVYLMWHAVGKTVKQAIYLCFIFIPTFFFFVLIGHRIFGYSSDHFRTMSYSFISVFHLCKGHLNLDSIIQTDTLSAALYYTALYIFVTFLLVAGFAMVFVEAYYVVQLTMATLPEHHWGPSQWFRWLSHPVLLSIMHFAMNPGSPPAGATGT